MKKIGYEYLPCKYNCGEEVKVSADSAETGRLPTCSVCLMRLADQPKSKIAAWESMIACARENRDFRRIKSLERELKQMLKEFAQEDEKERKDHES